MKIREIHSFLNALYPESTACEFDNPGLIVGDADASVHKVLLALDCTLATVKKAIDENCQLIITHHPVIFDPLKNVLAGSVVYELIRNNISVISIHTNLDIAVGGVNDCLCEAIGLKNIESFTASDGYQLRKGVLSPLSAKRFAEQIKEALGGNVTYTNSNNVIKSVLVCSGSGGKYVNDAVLSDFDAFVSSEIKHNQFIFAADNGISVFDAGHFNTEDVVLEPLKAILADKFKDLILITDHTNLISYT